MTLYRCALSAVLGVWAIASFAQSSETDAAENTTVYGVRLEQALAEVGSAVTVITSEQIEALGLEYALDAVATAPGVTVNQNGAFGGAASVRIRGAGSEQTLVLIDGVVTNDPSAPGGGFNFARFDASNIERIEILKGPQSTLWGTDAIGGVVNIVTKRPQAGTQSRVFAQAGSFNSRRGGGEFTHTNQLYDVRLAATLQSTDGISKADERNDNGEDDGFDSTTFSARAGVNLPRDARLQASVVWTDAEADFDSFVFGAQGNVGDGDELSETEELTGNLTFTMPLLDGRLDNQVLIGHSRIDRANFAGGLPSFGSKGERTTFRYQGSLQVVENQRLAFGAEHESSEADGEDTSIDGLFALYEYQPLDTLTLSAGLRRDDHERFGGETTARLALAYNPTEQLTLSASWGEGFKAPTLFQTTFFCCGATAANAALRPESSDAFDIGITVRSADDRGEIGVTYFDQDTTDLITFGFAIGGYENIARAMTRGVEVHGRYQLTDWLGASANFAYIDAEDGDGERLLRVPRRTGNIGLSFAPSIRSSATLLMRYNGSEFDPNGTAGSWTRVDLSGRFELNKMVDLYARVENLLDREYQQVIGYGTPGLSGFAGAQFTF